MSHAYVNGEPPQTVPGNALESIAMLELYAARGPRLFLDESSVFDIGSLIVGGADLSPGRAIPDDGDPRIDHSLEGFLFTCGPDHIRHPDTVDDGKEGEGRKYPLHGSFSSSPAQVTEFVNGALSSVARAVVMVKLADGGLARLERHWHIDGVTGAVSLNDRVTNAGSKPFAPMLMYHMNIGAKNFDAKTQLSGAMVGKVPLSWQFGEGDNYVFCVPAGGEEGHASVRLGPIAGAGGLTLRVDFDTATLPYLQMWRNESRPAYVVGIEPASHDWKPRAELAAAGALTPIQPGEFRDYALRFVFA